MAEQFEVQLTVGPQDARYLKEHGVLDLARERQGTVLIRGDGPRELVIHDSDGEVSEGSLRVQLVDSVLAVQGVKIL